MPLLVGLGNPGTAYAGNRHNIGFMAVDEIHRRCGFEPFRARFHGLAAMGRIANCKILALKPETFMNESGRSVAAAARFYKIPTEDVIVIHDDIDLRPGKVRVKRGGGPAGHNGLRDIDAHMGKDYRRVRVGVGHPGDPAKVQTYVLHDFAKAEQAWLGPLFDAVAVAFPLLVEGDAEGFMTRVAREAPPPALAARAGETAEGANGV
ncbi:MAG: aminoacyl-tRNA hydrolase [Alphaproteobacteria bacterium]